MMGFASLYPSYEGYGLQLRQIHFGIVGLAFDVLGDGLPADHFAALLVECQGRLSVKLPPAVQRVGHPMAECGVILAGEISVDLHDVLDRFEQGLRAAS